MDPKRFDALARVVSTPGSRRAAVRALAGLALGVGLDARGAAARRTAGQHARQDARGRKASVESHPAADAQSPGDAPAATRGSCPSGKKRCHGRCIPQHRPCRKRGGGCRDNGQSCKKNNQCCTQHCDNHVCIPKLGCAENGDVCAQNSDCCAGNCFGQVCAAKADTCGGTACNPAATGCCPVDGCCQPPANQCNAGGVCCAPNCQGKACGPDGCGAAGTCGTCLPGQTCSGNGTCQGQPTCGPQTCPNGCCDANGTCQPGNTEQACGDGGVTCTVCGSNQHCSTQTGTCRDNPPCSAATCPNGCCNLENGFHVCRTDLRGCTPGGPCCSGCCDSNEACQDGDDDGACGAGGSACVTCDGFHGNCDQGRCQCDAANCPGCCDNGPGQPGFCEQGNTNDNCGFGGVFCVACPPNTSCNGQGECTCINSNEFCGSGDQCIACPDGTECTAQGQCVCTAQSCSSDHRSCQNNQCRCDVALCPGCCRDGVCMPGDTPQACHTEFEAACTVCPPEDECVSGGLNVNGCCPSGWNFCGECCPPDQGCCWPGRCCSGQCCNDGSGGIDSVCCLDGVDCCNNACCPTENPRCQYNDEIQAYMCVV